MENFPVLGLLGPAGSGKDVVADWMVEKKGFIKVAFADPMKRFSMNCFQLSYDQLWGPSEERNREFDVDLEWWYFAVGRFGDALSEMITSVVQDGDRTDAFLKLHDWMSNLRKTYPERISVRVILQTLGTEWGRHVDPLMWARYTFKTIRWLKQDPMNTYTQISGTSRGTQEKAGVVIPDHRFINEVDYTQQHGGYVLRLRRLAKEAKEESVGIMGHRSESEQKTIPDSAFDAVLEFEEGLDKVDAKLKGAFQEEPWKYHPARSPS